MQLVHCTKLLSKIIQKSLEYVLQENTISVFLLQNSVLAVYFLYKLKMTSDFWVKILSTPNDIPVHADPDPFSTQCFLSFTETHNVWLKCALLYVSGLFIE